MIKLKFLQLAQNVGYNKYLNKQKIQKEEPYEPI
jgi:hypothetical protein